MNPAAAASNLASLSGLSELRHAAKQNDPAALKTAAKQFEAMFVQMLLKSSRDAKIGDDAFGGEQTGFYQDMFDQQMAQHVAGGRGLGIADLLVRQLQQKTASGLPLPPGEAGAPAPGEGLAFPKPRLYADPASLTPAPLPEGEGSKANKSDKQKFIEAVLPHAEKAAAALGVPAQALIAQAALETGWGKHVAMKSDGSSSHNLFGIKSTRAWDGDAVVHTTGEYTHGRLHHERAAFRAYDSMGQAFDDYAAMLKGNPRFLQALKDGSTHGFAKGLQQAGYATDPAYAQKIAAIADSSSMQVAMAQARSALA